jgi:signal transduction histidine kinase
VKRFKDYRLAKKQAFIVGVILVLMGGANGFLVYRMNALMDEIHLVTSRWLPSAVALGSIDSYASDLRTAQLQYAFADDDSTRRRLQLVMVDLIDKIQTNQDIYEPLINTSDQRELYEAFDEKWNRYLDFSMEFIALSQRNRYEEAAALLDREAEEDFRESGELLEQLVLTNEHASLSAAHRAEETFGRARRLSFITLAVAFLVAIAFATALVRLITTPVQQLAAAAERVTAGDVDVELGVIADDEIGALSRSFNTMTASLREAREKIQAQQRHLEAANEKLESKNRDLVEAMQQLREAQQQLVMREKMASLGNLVAGVAHEINNPVGAVKSAADTSARSIELVCRSLEESTDLEQLRGNKRFSTAIEILRNNNVLTVTASERIAEIVRSLRDFARLDEAEFQEADIHEGIDSTLTLLHHQLKNRIEVEKRYGDLPRIQCYPNQLNQVFMNLLSNAEQAIDGEGVITIETSRKGNDVVVRIGDTGKGIAADDLDKIFDPGFTTKGVGVGTGLGLSISYNIVSKHRGRIEAESEPGRGTTVTLTLPIHQESTAT